MKNSKEIEPLSQYTESSDTAVVPENRLAGTVGALLFSLAGGVVYFLLYQVGYIAAISGLIGENNNDGVAEFLKKDFKA